MRLEQGAHWNAEAMKLDHDATLKCEESPKAQT